MPRRKTPVAGDPFDDITNTLYGLPPEEFIDARTDLVAHAREAGDRDLAARIRTLRKPTHAAWALNTLCREHPDELAALLDVGAELRQAYAELSRDRMREASEQRRTLVSTLTRQAKALAAERGIRLGDTAEREVTESLEAALTDPDAAAQLGRGPHTPPPPPPPRRAPGGRAQLTTALHPPPSFPLTSAPSKAPAAPSPRPEPRASRAKAEGRTAQRKERERQRHDRQALAEAERAAEEAEQQAQAAEEDLASHQERLRQAQRAADDQTARVRDLSEQLDRAQEEARQADHRLRQTRRSHDAATRRAQQAQQQAERARERWHQLRNP